MLESNYSQYIHQSRYARWLSKEKRRETWEETVDRYVTYFSKKFGDVFPAELIKSAIYNIEVMPSMRALMTAGKALDRDNLAGYNCFSGDTEVTTIEYGVTTFEKISGQFVTIIDGNGEKIKLQCLSLGIQPVLEIELFNKVMQTKSIRATPNHRWILANGTEALTKDLQMYDALKQIKTPYIDAPDRGHWIVTSVNDYGVKTPVYCFSVPTTQSFLLNDGILTGNCAFAAIDDVRVFDEALYVLLNGCGFGFSAETDFIKQLPTVSETMFPCETTIVVYDSKLGWASAYKQLIALLYSGQIPKWDLSKVRPKGARLKTFGGRASGPDPLNKLFEFTVEIFKKAVGRKLNSLECHDLICQIASSVVVGGVRRCLPNTYKVLMAGGEWRYIDQVTVGSLIEIDGEHHSVLSVFDNGVQDTIDIVLEDGKTHTSTPEHYWLVYDYDTKDVDWVATKYLCNGIYAMLESKETQFNNKRAFYEMVNLNNYNLKKIVNTRKGTPKHVYDIEVDHPTHAFIAKSESGALGVSHNSSLISLSDISDERMRNAKTGEWYKQHINRTLANNSAAYNEKPDIELFIKEWASLIASKSGERGIYNRDAAIKKANATGKRDGSKIVGVNPCLTGDTLVAVADGRGSVSFKTLVQEGKDVPVFCYDENGNVVIMMMVNPRITGERVAIYEIKLSNGETIKATGSHKFLVNNKGYTEVLKLEPNDVLSVMQRVGHPNDTFWLINNKGEYFSENVLSTNFSLKKTTRKPVPVDVIDNEIIYSKTCHYCGETFKTLHRENMYHSSKCRDNAMKAMDDFRFTGSRGIKILSVDFVGHEDVYNGTVEDYHNFFIGGWKNEVAVATYVNNLQCGEINLRNAGLCNLSEIVLRSTDTLEDVKRKAAISSIIGTFQSLLTDFKYVRLIWKKNAIEERLLGSSMTGIMDHPVLNNVSPESKRWLAEIKDVVNKTNMEWCEKLGINPSCATTTVKPSGCQRLDNAILTTAGVMTVRELFEMIDWSEKLMEFVEDYWIKTPLEKLPKVIDEYNNEQNITGLYVNGLKHTIEVTFDDGCSYEFTENHRLETLEGMKRVDELSINECVVKGTGETTKITKLVLSDQPYLTADIEVAETHTYQLSNGVISHNTVSELVDTASGIHPRYSPYYLRSVRASINDPLAKMMVDQGVSNELSEMDPNNTMVFYFPKKSPETSVMRNNMTSIEQLEHYKMFREYWAEHNISFTCYVRPDEWLEVGAWVYKNWDDVGGISFLPYEDHIYNQAPFKEISKEEYEKLVAEMPEIDFSQLSNYEEDDMTTGSQEYACVGGACSL